MRLNKERVEAVYRFRSVSPPSVDVENLLLWIEALESGNYSQTQGVLRNSNGFCCLGVACEVAISRDVKLVWNPEVNVHSHTGYRYDNEGMECLASTSLPEPVERWLGSPWGYGDLLIELPNGDVTFCANANDSRGLTFLEIAAALRHTYLEE